MKPVYYLKSSISFVELLILVNNQLISIACLWGMDFSFVTWLTNPELALLHVLMIKIRFYPFGAASVETVLAICKEVFILSVLLLFRLF